MRINEFGQPRVDMFFVVPMVGKGYVPVYVTTDEEDAREIATEMNYVMASGPDSPDMFEVEGLYGPRGVQFEMARDADAMDWSFPGDPRNEL